MDCGENCPVTTTSSNWLISSLTSMFGNTFSRPVSMVTGNSLRWAVTDWTTIVYSPGGAANSKLPSPSDIPPNTVFFSVCGDDIARDFDLYPVLSRCGQDGQ